MDDALPAAPEEDEDPDGEAAAALLDPGPGSRARLAALAVEHAERLLGAAGSAPTFVQVLGAPKALAEYGIPRAPRDPVEVLDVVARFVDAPGVATTSPRYLGYIPSGGLYHAAVADFLAAAGNRYAGLASLSPGAAALETVVARWLCDVVGLGPSAGGVLTSGGSAATLTAVVAAREIGRIDPADARTTVVYATGHAHHCLDQALHVAGLGRVVRREVPMDGACRMHAASLADLVDADRAAGLRPWLLVGTAGTTSTGAVDPLADLAAVAEQHGLWFHVDGAYGGLFALTDAGRAVLRGIERADSVVVDPHKTLFLPYGTGAVLVRDQEWLRRTYGRTADYLAGSADDDPSPADLGPELTRHFRALRVWLPLQLAGQDAFRAALGEKLRLARRFHERLGRAPGFELGPVPDLSIVTYRYLPRPRPASDASDDPRMEAADGSADQSADQSADAEVDAFNDQLATRLQQDGSVFVSTARVRGRLVLRAAVSSFRTHRTDVDLAVETIRRTAERLAAG